MYIQIKTVELVPDNFGNYIKITKIGLYEDNGKWIKWVKLNDELVKRLVSAKIKIDL